MTIQYRVAYADTDAGGVVYHGRYFEFAERSRNEILYRSGLSFSELEKDQDVVLIVYETDAIYKRPAFVGDLLDLSSRVISWNPAGITWRSDIRRGTTRLCSIRTRTVGVSASRREIMPIPEDLLNRISTLSHSHPETSA